MALVAHRKKNSTGWRIGCFQKPWTAHRLKKFRIGFPASQACLFGWFCTLILGLQNGTMGLGGRQLRKLEGGFKEMEQRSDAS